MAGIWILDPHRQKQPTGAYTPYPPYFELVAEPWFRSQRGCDPRPLPQPPLLHADNPQQLTDFEHMAYPPQHWHSLPSCQS